MYGQFLSSFAVTGGVRKGCPISPLLLDFAMDDPLRRAFVVVVNCGMELLQCPRVAALGYADDVVLLCDDLQVVQTP